MKKKLFTLLTLALCVCSGAWAGDYVDAYGKFGTVTGDYIGNGISKIKLGSNASANSGLAIAKGKTGDFTISVPEGFTIKAVEFKDNGKMSGAPTTNDEKGNCSTSNNITTYTASSGITSVKFTVKAGSSNSAVLTEMKVSTSKETTDGYELITPSGAIADGAIPFTSSLGDGKLVTAFAPYGGTSSASAGNVDFGNGKGVSITTSLPIKAIYTVWYQRAPSTDAGWGGLDSDGQSIGTYTLATNEWAAPDENTTFVSLKRGEGSTAKLSAIHIFYYPQCPKITTQPEGANYVTGATLSPLTVAATASAGDLVYQWYSCDDVNKSNATAISGATSASFTPTAAGFYFVTVTDDNGSVDSDVVEIKISDAAAPTITIALSPAELVLPNTEVTLTATTDGNPTPTVQWYSNTTASTTGGAAIDGATDVTYNPSTAATGTFYFYAVATNSVSSVESNVLTLTVKEKVATPLLPEAGYFNAATKSITITCGTEDAAIEYSVDGGATWTVYTAAFDISATTTVQARATKDGFTASDVASAEYKQFLFSKTELATATEATTWDWTSWTETCQLTASTKYNRTDEFTTMSDIVDIMELNPPTTFETGKIAFGGEYVVRNKFAQNCSFKINISRPGTIKVTFSNTGGNNKDRFVQITDGNGAQKGSVEADGTTTREESFNVVAGDVTITGVAGTEGGNSALRFYKIEYIPASADITVPATGFSTYVNADYALNFDGTGITPYVIKANDANNVTLEAKTSVAKGEPVLLFKDGGTTDAVAVPAIATADAAAGNLLVAGDGSSVTYSDANHYYVLATVDGVTGFYRANNNPVPEGKAYLDAGTAAGARFFSLDLGNTTTGISSMHNAQSTMQNEVYNLNGQRVTAPQKGLFIVNGKKVIIK